MKIIAVILGIAFLIISGVMISLVRGGGALKPAGLIKPAERGTDPAYIAKQIATRLYPDFRAAKNVVWRLEVANDELTAIPHTVLDNYRVPEKPTLIDLRAGNAPACAENCWYIQSMDGPLPEDPGAEVFIQYFDREEKVPEVCDNEKILDMNCVRPISVREVHRKIKTPAPHFFMQRYHRAQFYLFIEPKSK